MKKSSERDTIIFSDLPEMEGAKETNLFLKDFCLFHSSSTLKYKMTESRRQLLNFVFKGKGCSTISKQVFKLHC